MEDVVSPFTERKEVDGDNAGWKDVESHLSKIGFFFGQHLTKQAVKLHA